jgi:hypothetical protein
VAKEDDQAIRDATGAAIASVRSLLNKGINPRAMVGTLSETELGLIVTSAVFAWIKAKAEAYMQYGVAAVEQAIKTMNTDPEPQQAGAVGSILAKLAEVPGLPWDKAPAEWSRDEMIKLAWVNYQLVTTAMEESSDNMPNVVRRSLTQTEREFNAAHGGPLMTMPEMADLDSGEVPF